MRAIALQRDEDHSALGRWALSAAIVMGCHAAAVVIGLYLYAPNLTPGIQAPAVMIDLAPAVSAAPPSQQADVAPGPEMQQADAPPPEPAEQVLHETPPQMLAPTPLREKPEIAAPIEAERPPEPAKPDPMKIERIRPKPAPPKPKPVRSERHSQSNSRPAPRTAAALNVERRADNVSGAVSGASSAYALASYNQIVAAHLQRFKQYPAAARAAGQQGVARVAFTLSRSGQVLGSSLAGSSGAAALDAETVAMVRRAQPFPPMPADIKQASMRFVVSVAFTAR